MTAKDLRKWIWYGRGGIKRDRDYWDSSLRFEENSIGYAWLDRKWGEGVAIDELASEIADNFPWYGIRDADDLREWLGTHPGPDQDEAA
jgi:hypothetical protein